MNTLNPLVLAYPPDKSGDILEHEDEKDSNKRRKIKECNQSTEYRRPYPSKREIMSGGAYINIVLSYSSGGIR